MNIPKKKNRWHFHLNFCSRFILRSSFFCFFSSTSGCSFRWLSHGWITEPHSIQMARAGANSNKNQNQFEINDSTWVPDVKIIKSLTFLQMKPKERRNFSIYKTWSHPINRLATIESTMKSKCSYSAIPPSMFKSLPESTSEPLSEYFAFDMNAINWYEPSMIATETNAIACTIIKRAEGMNGSIDWWI